LKAVIFGVNSQDGFFLSDILKKKDIEVTGISRSAGDWMNGSVDDKDFVTRIIKTVQPEFVFHLAANSTTKHWSLFENNNTISNGSLYLLEAVKEFSPHSKVFITGSGLQFINTGKPIKESDEFNAGSAYAMSRIQSVYAARYYRSLGIQTYVGYLFHHESPLRKGHHMSKYIANAAKEIENGSTRKIEIGDISVKKEWAYAEDIAEGIFTLVSQDQVSEATIGTGIAYSIEDWLFQCFKLINKNWKDFVNLNDPGFKAEYPLLVSDPFSINLLGWKAKTSFPELAKIMMKQN
jgi:GDPmannose 4,6-dehydratase